MWGLICASWHTLYICILQHLLIGAAIKIALLVVHLHLHCFNCKRHPVIPGFFLRKLLITIDNAELHWQDQAGSVDLFHRATSSMFKLNRVKIT